MRYTTRACCFFLYLFFLSVSFLGTGCHRLLPLEVAHTAGEVNDGDRRGARRGSAADPSSTERHVRSPRSKRESERCAPTAERRLIRSSTWSLAPPSSTAKIRRPL